jgi:hypothetical protein
MTSTPASPHHGKKFTYELVTSTQEKFKVEAWSTVTPGIIATEAIIGGRIVHGFFSVTHEKSGLKLDSNKYGAPLGAARLIAGALGGLPIDWTKDVDGVRADYGNLTDVRLRHWLNAK